MRRDVPCVSRPQPNAPAMPQQLASTVSTAVPGSSASVRPSASIAPKAFWWQ